jgi:hypothetical protein
MHKMIKMHKCLTYLFCTGVVLLLSSIWEPLYSQRFRGGMMAGFVTSQVDGDSHAGYNKASFNAGLFVTRPLGEKIEGHIELRYIRKGALEDRSKDGFYYRSKINYVEMPVTGTYKNGRFRFELGGAVGILVNSSEEDYAGELPESAVKKFNRLELSGIGGFYYEVTDHLWINFRGQYSILPIRENISDNIYALYYHQRYSFNNLMSFSVYYFMK